MSNTSIVSVYLILVIINIGTIFTAFSTNPPSLRRKAFFMLSIAVMCWQINEVLYFLVQRKEICEALFNTKLPFVAFTAFSFLYMILCFFQKEACVPHYVYAILFTFPLVIGVLALTSSYHQLLRQEISIIQLQPVHRMYQIRGPWFYIHTAYCYAILCVCIIVAAINHRKMSKPYRMTSITLIIAVMVVAICNILSIFIIGFPMDVTLIGTSLTLTFVYMAITQDSQVAYIATARDKTFYNWNESILLLDKNEMVHDTNLAAMRWFSQVDLKINLPLSFRQMLKEMEQVGITVRPNEADENEFDISYVDNSRFTSYRLSKQPIFEKNGFVSGWYASFSNVTRYKNLILQLEDRIGKDTLTGLSNRHAYLNIFENMDSKEHWPLSILMIDVNGLKIVNDTQGHAVGDQLLIAVAQKLTLRCPANGFLARIGGDEFIMMLPRTTIETARIIVEYIKISMQNEDRFPFRVDAAIGVATKTKPEQDLQALIVLADQEMYYNKQCDRRK